jgi:type II secretory pathway pseudopilin PulG
VDYRYRPDTQCRGLARQSLYLQPDAGRYPDRERGDSAGATPVRCLQNHVADEKAEREKQNQQQLRQQVVLVEQYRRQADELTDQLLAKNKELTRTQRLLNEKIFLLTLSDGASFTGIGPRALCLYSANLGYSTGPECDQYLSAANSGNAGYSTEASGTGRGLSSAGILRHSAGYGEWCQVLHNKLNTLRQLYGKEPQ